MGETNLVTVVTGFTSGAWPPPPVTTRMTLHF